MEEKKWELLVSFVESTSLSRKSKQTILRVSEIVCITIKPFKILAQYANIFLHYYG